MNKGWFSSLVVAALVTMPVASRAEVSANIGWVSDYVFRGIFQEDSSASAGLDYSSDSGFYLGTWGADVGQGLETDVYLGYGQESGDFSWTVGATGYLYTDNFDDTYKEVNLGIGYGIFALDVAVGKYDTSPQQQDYTFTSVTLTSPKGAYLTLGTYGQDFSGSYAEVGYSYDFNGLDLSFALIGTNDLQVTDPADGESGDYKVVFGITKSIGIGGSD
jgi:uncharacterized protein (TIGR02001 family)